MWEQVLMRVREQEDIPAQPVYVLRYASLELRAPPRNIREDLEQQKYSTVPFKCRLDKTGSLSPVKLLPNGNMTSTVSDGHQRDPHATPAAQTNCHETSSYGNAGLAPR